MTTSDLLKPKTTDATAAAKLAEIDALIEALHAELDACPNRLWYSEGNQYRLDLLIEYTAKRAALAA